MLERRKQLFNIGNGLLQSILETPAAPTHPHSFRFGVSGISTTKNVDKQSAPLIYLDTFERSDLPPFPSPDNEDITVAAGRKGDCMSIFIGCKHI